MARRQTTGAAAAIAVLVAVSLVIPSTARSQVPRARAGSDSPFAGRWEIRVQFPADVNPFYEDGMPLVIIDLADRGTSLSGTLIASMSDQGEAMKLTEVSVKDDQLLQLRLGIEGVEPGRSVPVELQLKRVGDHLEGTRVLVDGAKQISLFPMTYVGVRTTRDTLTPLTRRPPSADQVAFSSAMEKPPAERVAALKQFLRDFPDFSLKDFAILSLAGSYPSVDERLAALRAFVAEFPKSPFKDYALAEIATAEKAKRRK
jgi:hypothetical protein